MTDPQQPPQGGVFELRTPLDLYRKLERELRRMETAPDDPDVAFNFFVTAWHLLDWVYPGDDGARTRSELMKATPLLRLVSHLANGAKHFVVYPHFDSVSNAHGIAQRPPIRGAKSRFLSIEVSDDVRALFDNERPYVIEVAYKVRSYWHEHLVGKGMFK